MDETTGITPDRTPDPAPSPAPSRTPDHAEKPGPGREAWDVIVVGGGAAGLSAALTLGRACLRVLVVDAGAPRNRYASHLHGLPGHDGLDPAELLRRVRAEAAAYGVQVRPGTVAAVEDAVASAGSDAGLQVTLDGGRALRARALVVASGLEDGLPEIPGLAEQWGTGVHHCPFCHGWEVSGQRIAVLGTSPLSLHQAELLRQWTDRLTLLTAGIGAVAPEAAARLRSRGVELVDVPVAEVLADDGRMTGVRLADGTRVGLDAVFTGPRLAPRDGFLTGLGLDRTENPMGEFLAVDAMGRTSHPRIWAVGNVVNPGANLPISIGAGSAAAGAVTMALVTEDFDRAVRVADHWEGEYAGSARRWSGRVNATVADVVAGLGPGDGRTALDLGSGEGGDAVWLAGQGWRVTAVDVSVTATARGAEGAAEQGVGEDITWVTHDLTDWTTTEQFDLVTASFLHSTVELPRTRILRRAAERIRPGGHLLLVSHVFETEEDVPPWARTRHGGHVHGRDHGHRGASGHGGAPGHGEELAGAHELLLSPDQEVAALDLDPHGWEVVVQEVRQREATGPDGRDRATVKDGIVLLRRRHRD